MPGSLNTNFLSVARRDAPSQNVITSGINLAQVVDAAAPAGTDFKIELPSNLDIDTATDTVMLVTSDGHSRPLTRQGDYWRLVVGADDFGGGGTAPGSRIDKRAQFVVERLSGGVYTRWASQDFDLTLDRQIGLGFKSVGTLLAWYDAFTLSAIASGAAVASWSDSSDFGRTLTQGTGANQPLKGLAGNLRPYVRFDGSNDALVSTLGNLTGSLTVFVAQSFVSSDATLRSSVQVGGTGGPRIGMDNTNLGSRSTTDAANVTKPTNGVPHVAIATKNTSNLTIQLNATGIPASVSSAGAITAGVLELGDTTADAAANVDIYEVLVYGSVLGSTDIARVARALQAKWGIS